MKNVFTLLVALTAVFLSSGHADAGGSKNSSTKFRVVNQSGVPVAVIIDNSTTFSTQTDLIAQGGKIAQGNGSPIEFNLSAGAHTIFVYTVDSSGLLTLAGSQTHTVVRGKTLILTIDANGNPSFNY